MENPCPSRFILSHQFLADEIDNDLAQFIAGEADLLRLPHGIDARIGFDRQRTRERLHRLWMMLRLHNGTLSRFGRKPCGVCWFLEVE